MKRLPCAFLALAAWGFLACGGEKPPSPPPASAPPAASAPAPAAPDSSRVAELINQLSDPDFGARAKAAGELGSLGPAAKEAVWPLILAFKEPAEIPEQEQWNQGKAWERSRGIVTYGGPSSPADRYNTHIALALSRIGADAAEPLLETFLSRPSDSYPFVYSAFALERLGPAAAGVAGSLSGSLNHSDPKIKQKATSILRAIGTPEAQAALQAYGTR